MEEAQMTTIPHLFRCPISLDLFSDPVTLSTGQTYDRSSIQEWFAYGNLTCPVTMQKLHDPSLVPNHNLRHLIQQWRRMSHRFDSGYSTDIEPLLDMKRCLESGHSSLQEKLRILENIGVSMDETPSKIPLLLQIGLLPSLVELLLGNFDHVFSEKLLSCILKLMSFGEFGSLNMLKEESKIESFVVLFENGTAMIKQSLCQLIGAISSCSETRELCSMIGKNCRFSHRLVGLIRYHSETTEAGIEAVSALIEGKKLDAATAMATIERVLGTERAREELIKDPGGVKAAVKMVFRVSEHEGCESALNSLIMVCSESLEAREKAMAAGVLTQLLLLMQSQCSCGVKTKATTLLKLLRSKWDDEQ
ncbi:putative disease resistance protein RGA3-like isoform X1 [Hibiscus syriacus]|uniref:U-box domain-containing protein n=1 Tax=Hibiscus syriacus TaxID=106335 RepID=A0A6A2ZYH5_HIBSY|nr:putative disease resistance protein RGA3-like isoform X1 [Hibiscus syriacus]